MLNFAPFLYSISAVLPCSTVASGTYYLYSYFFDDSSTSNTIDKSFEINKDILLNQKDHSGLTTLKATREEQKSFVESSKQELTNKLLGYNNEKIVVREKILSLVSQISNATSEIGRLKEQLSKKIGDQTTKKEEEGLLSLELHKLNIAEIKDAEAFQEAEKNKKTFDNKIDSLRIQKKTADSYKNTKTREVETLQKNIDYSTNTIETFQKTLKQAEQEKKEAESAFNDSTTTLQGHKTSKEDVAAKNDKDKGQEITGYVIEKKEIFAEKLTTEKLLLEAQEKQNTEKTKCQTTLRVLGGKNYNGNCEFAPIDKSSENPMLALFRKTYFTVRQVTRDAARKIEELERKFKKIDKQWEKAKQEKKSTEEELKKAKATTLSLTKLKQEASTKNDSKIAQYVQVKGDLESAKKEHTIKVKEMELLKESLTKATETADNLDKEISALDAQEQQITDAYQTTLATWTLALDNKKTQQLKVDAHQDEIKKLDDEIGKHTLELNKENQTKNLKTTDLAEERENLETLDILIPGAKQQIKDKNEQINNLSTEIEAANTLLKSLNSEISKDSGTLSNPIPDTTFNI